MLKKSNFKDKGAWIRSLCNICFAIFGSFKKCIHLQMSINLNVYTSIYILCISYIYYILIYIYIYIYIYIICIYVYSHIYIYIHIYISADHTRSHNVPTSPSTCKRSQNVILHVLTMPTYTHTIPYHTIPYHVIWGDAAKPT